MTAGGTAGLPPAPSHGGRRLAFPDALRGLAALWVVLFHFGAGRQLSQLQAALPDALDRAIFGAGHFGVPIFFVLSGFVIALSIGDDAVDAGYVGRFALRRAIRLDLPYWGAIAIGVAALEFKRAVTGAANVPTVTVGQVVAHMFYLQEFLGLPGINPVFWTLTNEVQFYLLFCILLGLAHTLRRAPEDRRSQHALFALAAVAAVAWPLVRWLHVRGLAMANWHGFLLGAFVAWSLSGTMRTRWFAAFAAAMTGVWVLTGDSFTLVCVLTATGMLLVGRAGHLGDWCDTAPLQFLGRVSYSLYLLHVPVSGAAFHVLRPLLAGTAARELLAMVLVLAVNLAVAQLFWWGVERPSTALARRLRKR
ncbi:MAG: acyltransferase [Gemmatimonadaceae bacterium]|nr:acyltransferase [Gemmatimonadaceae bacterium]